MRWKSPMANIFIIRPQTTSHFANIVLHLLFSVLLSWTFRSNLSEPAWLNNHIHVFITSSSIQVCPHNLTTDHLLATILKTQLSNNKNPWFQCLKCKYLLFLLLLYDSKLIIFAFWTVHQNKQEIALTSEKLWLRMDWPIFCHTCILHSLQTCPITKSLSAAKHYVFKKIIEGWGNKSIQR